jgi:uncharacterized protein (TIGR00288 family)
MEEKKVAILIDADNTSKEYLSTIIEEATKEGIVTYKRIYADWTCPQMQTYKNMLLEHSVIPMQQYSYTTGKNATDSAMIIDAMDILYSGNIDVFCLCSSDSDFTRLAQRLREAGKQVIGMGRKQTPQPFVKACNKFKMLDLIMGEGKTSKKENTLTIAEPIKNTILKILEEESGDDGFMLANVLGSKIQKLHPDFDVRNYGCNKLIELLEQLGFEIKKEYKNPQSKKSYDAYIKIKK